MTRDLVYARRPVREALRGPREVLELWASERAVRSEEWLREVARPRVQTKLERDLFEAAGTRDHQGVVAWCEPYRYADAFQLASGEMPLLACLDQVSDPRNLGAVIRSAEGAGASGVVVPAHGSARVTAAVCRASAGAVEHLPVAVVPNLARYLAEIKRGDLWIAGAVGESGTPMWKADLSGGHRARLRRRGQGPTAARAADLRPGGLDSAARAGGVAQRQRRRRSPALRSSQTAEWLSRPSTSSTGSTFCTRAGSARPRSCGICSRAGSRLRAPEGCSSSTATGRTSGTARSRFAGPRMPTLCSSGWRSRIEAAEEVAIVSSDTAVRGTTGIEVRKLASQTFLGELSRPVQPPTTRGDLRDRLDPDTLARLERLRRGER